MVLGSLCVAQQAKIWVFWFRIHGDKGGFM